MEDIDNTPLIQSKSSLKNQQKKNAIASTEPTPVVEPLDTKKVLTPAQMEQRKRAAISRTTKQKTKKRKEAMLQNIARMFDEDEEGVMRRMNPSHTNTVVQDVVEEEPMLPTPAAQELPKESGLTEKAGITFEDQADDINETHAVLNNFYVPPGDVIKVPSLASQQQYARNIYNTVQQATVEQGIVLLPLPTYHQSG